MSLHDRIHAAVTARQERAQAAPAGSWVTNLPGLHMDGTSHGTIRAPGRPFAVQGSFASGAPNFIAAEDPVFVLAQCDRDLRVLGRHAPTNRDEWRYGITCQGCPNAASRWPCEEIADLATAYGIEAS